METPAQTFTFEEINVLGNIINTYFGKSSIRDNGINISCSLEGNRLMVKYNTVVYFNSSDGLATQKKEHERMSNEGLNKKLKEIKDEFRDKVSRSLKVKEIANTDDVELISASSHSERKIAYYRRLIVFEIS